MRAWRGGGGGDDVCASFGSGYLAMVGWDSSEWGSVGVMEVFDLSPLQDIKADGGVVTC